MFDLSDIDSIEEDFGEAYHQDQEMRNRVKSQFNNFVKVWEGYKKLSGKASFSIDGRYLVQDPDDIHSFEKCVVFSLVKRPFKKLMGLPILTVHYDYHFMIERPETEKTRDFRFIVVSLDDYDPAKNDVYEVIFNELKSTYERLLKKSTHDLRVNTAYQELSLPC